MKRFQVLLIAFFLVIPLMVIGSTLMGTNYSRCEQILLEMGRTQRDIDKHKADIAKYEAKAKFYKGVVDIPTPNKKPNLWDYLYVRNWKKAEDARGPLSRLYGIIT